MQYKVNRANGLKKGRQQMILAEDLSFLDRTLKRQRYLNACSNTILILFRFINRRCFSRNPQIPMLDKIEFIEFPEESMSEDSKPFLTQVAGSSGLEPSETLYESSITASKNSAATSRLPMTVSRPDLQRPQISTNSHDDDGIEQLTLRDHHNVCHNSYYVPNNSRQKIPESISSSTPRNRSIICQTTIDFMTNCMKKMSEDEELELSAAVVAAYSAILAR